MRVFRRTTFNAAHRLYRSDWSDEKNADVFGKCSNPNFHGHNYVLEVGISGPINPETGYIIDLKELKTIINEHVADYFDHRNLNLDIPEFEGLNPTVENIAKVSHELIRKHLSPQYDLLVRLYETPNNWVEYTG